MVELRLLTDDAVGVEAGLGQGEPAGGPVAPEGRQLDVPEAGRLVKLDEVLLVLGHVEKIRELSTVSLYQNCKNIHQSIPCVYSRQLKGQEKISRI